VEVLPVRCDMADLDKDGDVDQDDIDAHVLLHGAVHPPPDDS